MRHVKCYRESFHLMLLREIVRGSPVGTALQGRSAKPL